MEGLEQYWFKEALPSGTAKQLLGEDWCKGNFSSLEGRGSLKRQFPGGAPQHKRKLLLKGQDCSLREGEL